MNAQQLKNSILQEAIEGRLVPQDPNEEPASVLLEKIRKEKKRLVKEGKLKKKDLEEIPISKEKEEIPFDIPESWEWVRLDDITIYISRGKSPVYSEIRKYPVVAQKCNQWSGFSIEKAKFVDPNSISKYAEERLLVDGDLLWNSTGLGTLGRMAIYNSAVNQYGWAVADSHVTVIRTRQDFCNYKYLYYYFASHQVQSVIEDKSDGSTKQKELSQETVRNYEIPLPPLAEQHRIVAKIEELLPEIEEYGKAQEALDKLNAELPERLKKSILQEAIEGRLVPQDPNDEPASVLLEKIRKEKKRLVKEGKLKKKDLEERPISKDEIPFEIPNGWEWVRWGTLGDYKKGPFGSSLTKSMFIPKSDEAVKVYEQKNAIQKDYSLGDYFISAKKYETMKGFTVHPGDIIVSCAGTIGETYLLPDGAPKGIINQALMRARLYLDSIIPYWLLNFRYILLIENKLKGAGSAIKNIPPFEVLKAMPVPLPPLAEQHRIVAKIEQLLNEINKLKE